ncbi:MAG: PilZ domain-containing protein [Xanthomonadales bacterium]|nr:PilZ domain-containing protein [Xanthomonadales bacterium]
MSTDEKRRFPRLPIFSAALITHAGQGWLSEVRDLSQGGACLARPRHWTGDERRRCRIYFIFDQETVIAIDADCVRNGQNDLGFEFDADQETAIEALIYESRFIGKDEP